MPVSLTNRSSVRPLQLLLVVLNLLLWGEVTSVAVHTQETDHVELSLQELFDHAVVLSQNISGLATDMRMKFFSNEFSSTMFNQFLIKSVRSKNFMLSTLTTCHTLSINTPETVAELKNVSCENLLKMAVGIVHAWNCPLQHLVTELSLMPGVPAEILSPAKEIKALNEELLERIKRIFSKVHTGTEENLDYPIWPELENLQSSDKKLQFYTLYKLSYCLRVDTSTVDFYLKLLRCLQIKGDICYTEGFR